MGRSSEPEGKKSIEREALERMAPLRRANSIVHSFHNDQDIYPDRDVRLRKGICKRGICKTLAEEYCPLVRLAHAFCCVKGVRLFAASNPGPDGEILLWSGKRYKVQITCVNESDDRYLMLEQLQQYDESDCEELVFPYQKHFSDKSSKEVTSDGRKKKQVKSSGPISIPSEAEMRKRVDRIQEAIKKKDDNYHVGTDILLIRDDPASSRQLREGGLHDQVCELVQKGLGSKYERIYVSYGEKVRRAK